jgi:hypothetical protein
MNLVPHPLYSLDLTPCDFSLFTAILVQLRWLRQNHRHTLTEHKFQDAFKKCQNCWEWCIHLEGAYFEVYGGQ